MVAKYLKETGDLAKNTIVVTEYSNQALINHLVENGIEIVKVPNGDRAVAWKCEELGLNFGGEQTGHFLFTDYSEVGDGTLASLLVMRILIEKKKTLSELAYVFEKYPQKVFNVEISKKVPLEELAEFQDAVKKWESNFDGKGRIYSRYSGTENLLRIMVEAENKELIDQAGTELSSLVKNLLS
jgi:phosphoglucosamine mutase